MTRLSTAVLLVLALLASRTSALLDVHDTLVSGVPWISVEHLASKAKKGPKQDPSGLRIDRDRGIARARLTLPDGSNWIFWNQSPFVRQGRGVASLGLSARVSNSSLIVPVDGPIGRKLRSLQKTKVRTPETTSVSPAPVPSGFSEDSAPSIQAETPTSTSPDSPSPADSPPPSPPLDPSTSDSSPKPPEPVPDAPQTEAVPTPETVLNSTANSIFTVVLDAGHGGKDPGAVGKKVNGKALMEKEATLAIAKLVQEELRTHKEIRVVLTRDQDEFLSLGERTRKANQVKGELFVSIHCNSLPLTSTRRDEVQGFMIYLLREAKSEADRAIERRENEAIRFETGERQRKDALSPLEWVMLEHQLNLYTKESERFAELVVKNLETKGPMKKERTGAGQAGFFVLVGALMPSVLIETGYVSNDSDAENLGTASGRKSIARQIARSIQEFQRTRR